jgi:hypothetical protein
MSEQTLDGLVAVSDAARDELVKILVEKRAANKVIRLVFAGFG